MEIISDLYKLCDTLGESLKEANEKIRNAGGKLSPTDVDYVNKLTHAIKSVKTSIAMIEAEDMDDGGSYDDGNANRGSSYARNGGSYRDGGGSYDGGSYDSRSYARGRGRNARRDSMGRYSNRGYSRDGGYSGHGDMVEELRELMADAPDETTRMEMQRLIQKMEQR